MVSDSLAKRSLVCSLTLIVVLILIYTRSARFIYKLFSRLHQWHGRPAFLRPTVTGSRRDVAGWNG